MLENISRQTIIEDCLEKRLPRFETNKLLLLHNFKELEGGEADCYDVMINSAKKSNPRQKIIASCLIQGLSKAAANLQLYEKKFRKLSGEEITYYEDVLSRIRFCGADSQLRELKKQEYIPPREEVIKKAVLNKFSVDELSEKLEKYGHSALTDTEKADYKKQYNEFHNKRDDIIKNSLNLFRNLSDLNRLLKEENLPKLNLMEEINYQKEREKIFKKQRDELIKECIGEKYSCYEIDKLLLSKGFEKLSAQETDKINAQNKFVNTYRSKRKTTELSEQFRKLYRRATKSFHPDRYSDFAQKSKATLRMKEINAAKDQNDFFMLKELLQKYENEDNQS